MSQRYDITLKAKDGSTLEEKTVHGKQDQILVVEQFKSFITGDCIKIAGKSEKYIGRNERGSWKPLNA